MTILTVALIVGEKNISVGFNFDKDNKAASALCFTDETSGQQSVKSPPSMLLNEANDIIKFGFDADTRFKEYEIEDSYKYIDNFTKLNNTEGYTRDVYIEDLHGNKLPAVDMLTKIVKHLVQFTFDRIGCCGVRNIGLNDAQFVITVPTNWGVTAKKCMKVATSQAGIEDNQLMIIAESEAAATACQDEIWRMGGLWRTDDNMPDKKVLAIQWEDSRISLSVYETKFDGTQRIRHLRDVSLHGFEILATRYLSLLANICKTDICELSDLNQENIKSNVRKLLIGEAKWPEWISLKLGFEIAALLRDKTIEYDGIKILGDKIRIRTTHVLSWVKDIFYQGLQHIREAIATREGITDLIMFGDFAESQIVLDMLQSSVQQGIDVPKEVGTCVIRGAVTYGQNPNIYAHRIARFCDTNEESQKERNDCLIVAAIDFGTSFSGYAYTYRDSPQDIFLNNWNSGNNLSTKAPTTVLVNPQKKFDSFGYEAEEKYAELSQDETKSWMFFRRFKMTLHNDKTLCRATELADVTGKKMPALDIFAMAIRYLKDTLLERIRKSKCNVQDSDILFMLTVPAIWGDAAKQFMREAAVMAGIDKRQVKLTLEPEAASAWCQAQKTNLKVNEVTVGERFMVADLGGGTADFTIHEKLTGYRLKEVHRASGGAWGGTNVDASFFHWLSSLAGKKTVKEFQKREPIDYLEMERRFEFKKRDISPETKSLMFKVPLAFLDTYSDTTGKSLQEEIAKANIADLNLNRDKLRIPADEFKKWFRETISAIVSHVQEVLSQTEDVQMIMLVGGFSQCKQLQKQLLDSAGVKQIVIPEMADVAVLKGAVTAGLRPSFIASRIARFSYGIAKSVEYDRKVHDRSKARRSENGELVIELFEQFISVDEEITIGEIVAKGFDVTEGRSNIKIYSSTESNPRYVSDWGCSLIGEITLDIPDGTDLHNEICDVHFSFGKTELIVEAMFQKSGEQFTTHIDCL